MGARKWALLGVQAVANQHLSKPCSGLSSLQEVELCSMVWTSRPLVYMICAHDWVSFLRIPHCLKARCGLTWIHTMSTQMSKFGRYCFCSHEISAWAWTISNNVLWLSYAFVHMMEVQLGISFLCLGCWSYMLFPQALDKCQLGAIMRTKDEKLDATGLFPKFFYQLYLLMH